MALRRVVSAAALLAALALQIFYDGYLARFVLAWTVALPLLSLVLSLPGALGLRLGLRSSPAILERGEEGAWRLWVKNPLPLPVAGTVLDLEFQNRLTGESVRERVRTAALRGGLGRTFPMASGHCGVLSCRLVRARSLDLLGIFSFPVRRAEETAALVLPGELPRQEVPGLPRLLAALAGSGNGKGSGEDYELREYRPGDGLRTIHWKLSSKRDELVVRETLGGEKARVVITVELFGDAARLDRVLERLWTTSLALLAAQVPHRVLWTDGDVQEAQVTCREELLACMERLLSRPAPAGPPPEMPELTHLSGVPRLHIAAGEEGGP